MRIDDYGVEPHLAVEFPTTGRSPFRQKTAVAMEK